MKRLIALFFAMLLLLSGCASRNQIRLFNSLDHNQSNAHNRTIASVRLRTHLPVYHIKRYDRLMVVIENEMEISTPPKGFLVDHLGAVTLPIIGRIRVAGLTQPGAAMKIQRAYRRLYSDTVVSVEVPDKRLFVIGDVKKPGPIPLPHERSSLLEAISAAGGFRDHANREAIYLVRRQGARARLRRLSLSGTRALANAFVTLLPGDIVYVAPSDTKMAQLGIVESLKIIDSALSPFATTKTLLP